MEYQTSPQSIELFEQFVLKLKNRLFPLTISFAVFSVRAYNLDKPDPSHIIEGQLIMFITFLVIIYIQIISKAQIINRTITIIDLHEGELILSTSSVKYLPGIVKESRAFKLPLNKVAIQKTNYPLKDIFNLERGTFKIVYNKKELFLIADFFDSDLLNEISTSSIIKRNYF